MFPRIPSCPDPRTSGNDADDDHAKSGWHVTNAAISYICAAVDATSPDGHQHVMTLIII